MSRENTGFALIGQTQINLDLVSKTLKTRLPKSALTYNVMKLLAEGVITKELAHNVNIYAFEAELEDNDKTFLCVQLNFEIPKVVLTSAPEHPSEEMIKAFSHAMVNDWAETPWYEMEKTLWSQVENRLGERKPALVDETSFVVIFPFDKTIKEIPTNTDFELKPLSLKDAHTVNQHWFIEGPPEKIKFIEDAINLFTSAGIYIKAEESPAAFGVASLLGSINCVHTMDNHRRKGFAVFVIQAILNRFKELGLIPCAHIVKGNSQSEGLFNKLGFTCASVNIFVSFDDRIVRESGNNDNDAAKKATVINISEY